MTEVKRILAVEGTIATHQTIIGSVRHSPRIRQTKSIPLSPYRPIDEAMAENGERTAAEWKTLLADKFVHGENVTHSERTITRAMNELGWTFTTGRYYRAIRDASKVTRVAWVNKCLEGEQLFSDALQANAVFS